MGMEACINNINNITALRRPPAHSHTTSLTVVSTSSAALAPAPTAARRKRWRLGEGTPSPLLPPPTHTRKGSPSRTSPSLDRTVSTVWVTLRGERLLESLVAPYTHHNTHIHTTTITLSTATTRTRAHTRAVKGV